MAQVKKVIKKKSLPPDLEAYMPLVHSIASMVSGKGLPPNIDYNDLVSDGTVGLMKAWNNFDPNRGVKFETYASYRIRGEILDGLRNYNPVPYRVQVMIRDMAQKGTQAVVSKKQQKEDESLEKKELSEAEFKTALNKIKKIVSASALMYLLSLEGVSEKGEIEVAGESSVSEQMEFQELRNRLKQGILNLPEDEREVVDLFYNNGINQKTIAAKLKLSRSKVNRLLGKAIIHLKERLK
ncbi:MAG: sigma-70 family RNA polymerase sigma factor [Candidatus Saganbacteria bacterium]|nr:sigma-70 family RNA polymerase sigma factor [Candidatus Saganbacteria bacterium]